MNKRLFSIVAAIIASMVGFAAYAVFAGPVYWVSSVQARSSTMPAHPHILYLAPRGATRGLVNATTMKARAATPVHSWPSARLAALTRPLDAMLIDAAMLKTLNTSDRDWLRAQFRDGVTLAALGVEDDEFAPILGLQTLRAPAEGIAVRGPLGYRLVRAIAIGTPEDLRRLESIDWQNRAARSEDTFTTGIQLPLVNSFRHAQGQLDSEAELELLFFRIHSTIEDTYQMRAEFQQMMKNFKGK